MVVLPTNGVGVSGNDAHTTGMELDKLTVGYQGHAGAWRGVLKCDGQPVWVCRHLHHNRDQSGRWNGMSARECAGKQLIELRMQALGKTKRFSMYGGDVWA